jgi:hypothetical protein
MTMREEEERVACRGLREYEFGLEGRREEGTRRSDGQTAGVLDTVSALALLVAGKGYLNALLLGWWGEKRDSPPGVRLLAKAASYWVEASTAERVESLRRRGLFRRNWARCWFRVM